MSPALPEVLVHCCPFLGISCVWGPLKRRSHGHLVAALHFVSRAQFVPSRPLSPASRDGSGCCHVDVLSSPFVLVFFYGVLSALCFRDCEALWSALHIPVSVAQAAVRSSINQGEEASRIALDEGFRFFNKSISWETSLTSLQRGTTGVTDTFRSFGSSFLLLASSSWCVFTSSSFCSSLWLLVGFVFVGCVCRVRDGRVRVRASVAHFRWGRFRFLHRFLHSGPATWSSVDTSYGSSATQVSGWRRPHTRGLHLLRPPKFHRVLFPRIRFPSP